MVGSSGCRLLWFLTMSLLCWWSALSGHQATSRAGIRASWRAGWIVGAAGRAIGFVGPLVISPKASLGPLLGILLTGPLGFVVGALGAGVLRVAPRVAVRAYGTHSRDCAPATARVTSTDLDFVATMMGDGEVTQWYGRRFGRPMRRSGSTSSSSATGSTAMVCGWSSTARRVSNGQVGLMLQEVEGVEVPEIGWLLHRPFSGCGYATEAAAATRDAAFTRWRYGAVISLIRPVNTPSQRVAQRIGMQPGRLVDFEGFQQIVFQVANT